MVILVAGLVIVNAGGTFARLIESHLAGTVAASTSVGERLSILDAKINEQSRRVAGIEAQAREVADAISHMKPKAALAAVADQGKRREAIARGSPGGR
jgi:hypothetical protein